MLPSLVINEAEEVLSSDRETNKETNLVFQNDHIKSLLPPDLAGVIGDYLGRDDFENAQGLRSLAVQHPDYSYVMALDTDALSKSLEDFEKCKKSVETVITYLLKHHGDCLQQDINFRYVKLNRLMLSNPALDSEGFYTVDMTSKDYTALKQAFQDEMGSGFAVNLGIVVNALIALLFLLLFFFKERNLLFCSDEILTEWGPGSRTGFAPASLECSMGGPTLAGAWGCGDFFPIPDICSEEHVYCPAGSFLNSAWVYMASILNPFGNQGAAMSCSYTNQVGFIIGACIFSLIAAFFADMGFDRVNTSNPVPDVLRENWENVQRFFKNSKADFSLPPLKINPNADVDRIAVISR